jgi:hypothetical protein
MKTGTNQHQLRRISQTTASRRSLVAKADAPVFDVATTPSSRRSLGVGGLSRRSLSEGGSTLTTSRPSTNFDQTRLNWSIKIKKSLPGPIRSSLISRSSILDLRPSPLDTSHQIPPNPSIKKSGFICVHLSRRSMTKADPWLNAPTTPSTRTQSKQSQPLPPGYATPNFDLILVLAPSTSGLRVPSSAFPNPFSLNASRTQSHQVADRRISRRNPGAHGVPRPAFSPLTPRPSTLFPSVRLPSTR